MREKQITLFVSSDVSNGADYVSQNGSYFNIDFQEHIHVPNHAESCTLELHAASIWWTNPNISFELANNTAPYTWTGASGNDTVILPSGLYNLADLNISLNREITNLTGVINMITLGGDDATGKVTITYNTPGFAFNFVPAGTIRDIIGFAPRTSPPPFITVDTADYKAEFSNLEHFLVHSDLVSNGMIINNNVNQTIAKVPIIAEPGHQIVYEPTNPLPISADELIGKTLSHATFWLTDHLNLPVHTNNEVWTAVIVIRYMV